MPRIRMCDEDREKWPGPEWVEVEMADLLDESTGLIEQLEETWRLTPGEFLNRLTRGSVKGIRALMWLGRWKAGCKDDPRTFAPRTQEFSGVLWEPTQAEQRRADERAGVADAGPPANRAARRAAPKAAKKAAKKASPRRATAPSGN